MTDMPHFWEELEAKLRQGIPGLAWPWLPGIQDLAHREAATLDSLLAQTNIAPNALLPVSLQACYLGLVCHQYCMRR